MADRRAGRIPHVPEKGGGKQPRDRNNDGWVTLEEVRRRRVQEEAIGGRLRGLVRRWKLRTPPDREFDALMNHVAPYLPRMLRKTGA
jgi:hypothetical protein